MYQCAADTFFMYRCAQKRGTMEKYFEKQKVEGKLVLWSMTTTDSEKTAQYLNTVEKTGDNIKKNLYGSY